MYAIIDENDKIIQISDDQISGSGRVKVDKGVWIELSIPGFLEGKVIKYDVPSGGLIEDVIERDRRSARKLKKRDARILLRDYDSGTADLDDTKAAIDALIVLAFTPQG